MESALKLLTMSAAGFLLLSLNLWFAKAFLRTIRPEPPSIIRPFQVIGKADANLGVALAHLLRGSLARIRGEARSSAQALEDARQLFGKEISPASASGTIRAAVQGAEPISVPEAVFEPLQITMSVGGVELGPTLGWLRSWLVADDALQVTVHYSGTKATISSNAVSGSSEPLWLVTKGDDDAQLIDDLAYKIAQAAFAQRHEHAWLLDVAQFRTLIQTLTNLATLNRKAAISVVPTTEYEALLRELDVLLPVVPRWTLLVRLTGDVAFRAGNLPRALELAEAELKLLPLPVVATTAGDLKQRIARLKQDVDDRQSATLAFASNSADQPQGIVGELRLAVGATVLGGDVAPLLYIVGSGNGKGSVPDFVREVADAARLVIPELVIRETPVDLVSPDELNIVSFYKAIASLKPKKPEARVILVPFGSSGVDLAMEDIVSDLASSGCVFVLTAGAYTQKFNGKALIVDSVDRSGKPSSFSECQGQCLWAPGERIPVRDSRTGRIVDFRDGTGYAAAVVAAIAATLVSRHPTLKPEEVLRLLLSSAQSSQGRTAKIVNLRAALALAAQMPAPPNVSPR